MKKIKTVTYDFNPRAENWDLFQKIKYYLEPKFNKYGWSWIYPSSNDLNCFSTITTIIMHNKGRFTIPLRYNINLKLFVYELHKIFDFLELDEYKELLACLEYESSKENPFINVEDIDFTEAPLDELKFAVNIPKYDLVYDLVAKSEARLRDYLFERPELIEGGLKVISKEFKTPVGRIDLLCMDVFDRYVVVELKKNKRSDRVLGQIQRYMGWMKEDLGIEEKKEIRGIIIQQQPDKKLEYALKMCENIEVKYYRFQLIITDEV